MSASETQVHTCSYSCQRPECMNAQRAELLAKLAEFASVEVPEEPTRRYGYTKGAQLYVREQDYDALLHRYKAQAVRMRELEAALEGLLADITEYQTINKLGGENNHWQVEARKALAGKEVK